MLLASSTQPQQWRKREKKAKLKLWTTLRAKVLPGMAFSDANDLVQVYAKSYPGNKPLLAGNSNVQHIFWQVSLPSLHDQGCQTWLKLQCVRRFINFDRRDFDFVGNINTEAH